MLTLTRPSPDRIQRFLDAQRGAPFAYREVGATRRLPAWNELAAEPSGDVNPSDRAETAARAALARRGYVLDHNRVRLGAGAAAFERAKDALRRWTMFDLGWVELHRPDAPIAVGTTVAIGCRVGLHTLSAARIAYVIDERAGPVRRFGFAYGTLPDHVERGEERFTVEWHADAPGGPVFYDIVAFSRPNRVLVRAGYPLARGLQRRFARDSKARMVAAVAAAAAASSEPGRHAPAGPPAARMAVP